jgi:SAM-dependent methyltransferase
MSGAEINFDDLNHIPPLASQNYMDEHDWLVGNLPQGARVLQVGSYDGQRILRLLAARPDLDITGLEIDEEFVTLAQNLLAGNTPPAAITQGDILSPPKDLGGFDYVLCLNNTLGYVAEPERALANMKRLGKIVVVSVFCEEFDAIAAEYRTKTGSSARRFDSSEVDTWGGIAIPTPLGRLVQLSAA